MGHHRSLETPEADCSQSPVPEGGGSGERGEGGDDSTDFPDAAILSSHHIRDGIGPV